MNTYEVEATIGSVYATVEAENEEKATDAAVAQWDNEAWEIFTAATFTVRATDG